MSLTTRLHTQSTIVALIEVAAFFLLITPIFILVSSLCIALVLGFITGQTPAMGFSPSVMLSWFISLPIWAAAMVVAGYFVLITFYWKPGDERQNEIQVRGLAVFMLLGGISAGMLIQQRYHAISDFINPLIQAISK